MKKSLRTTLVAFALIIFATPALAQESVLAVNDADLPPNATPGECYARVLIPERYQTNTERVMVREASQRIETVAPVYRTVDERVMVKEASERIETVPAVYETVTERVLVKPAYTTWKKGEGAITKVDNSTGEIMCLVEVPAEYKTVTKRVLKVPATTRKVSIPAEYQTVRVRKLVESAKERAIDIPAEYDTVVKREKISDSRMEWQSILCQTNADREVISSLQRALKMRGYDPGRVDGVLGRETMDAVATYQRNKGIASGQLTMETLKSLNVL
ncbi:MAG: peptidoglycan-binding protein [Rhodothermaceae bacterium]|nr:peptidoglycan-binding protein [Rhodothermaceae bacterium]